MVLLSTLDHIDLQYLMVEDPEAGWVMVMVMVVKDTRYHRACQTGRFVTCLPQKTSYKMEKLDDKSP